MESDTTGTTAIVDLSIYTKQGIDEQIFTTPDAGKDLFDRATCSPLSLETYQAAFLLKLYTDGVIMLSENMLTKIGEVLGNETPKQ